MESPLQKAFSSDSFRQQAHTLVDLLADYLEQVQSGSLETVIPYKDPEENLTFWQEDYEQGQGDVTEFFRKTINHSIHLHHPRYMGHQVTPPVPVSALAGMLTGLLNNGMAVYEMGLVSNPLERILSELLAQKIGFDNHANGLLTSGGTLANLTALLAARAAKTDVWENGNTEHLAVMVSEEAHYCIDRAARIMGMGSEGIIKVPTNERLQIRTNLLEQYYQEATDKGLQVIAIVGSACSTSTGSYDDLEAIAAFAQKHQLWFHADGAHGGAVVFSDRYKHLIKGMNQADSVVIDWHKMLMAPALTTALIFKRGDDAFKTFQQKAQYLWANQHSKDWFNSGKRTFECTKLMMSVKVYAILKAHGEQIFTDNVEYLYDLGKTFATLVKARPNFELALEPESNIVCFRLLHESASLNELNANIRKRILEEGKFYIVQTTLGDKLYLRVSIMNPLTTETDLVALLDEVERLGKVVAS
ncbi:pyridoxal phosphate-dependent decarboxylase family protein [Emticicia agri]|uniref:Pyridoxal-dependent decarboxylase n=1 Tax=Emticicia agri TaxID=2492393 RepID=A0A4Q5LVW0_9BACT|nr:pyridoxal-dependent decarboxylase [Emticicia agri]RYU93881.1 pyridoxal-dependent decarboxylase [Emticicia agri]